MHFPPFSSRLGASSKLVGSAVAQLLTAAAQGNEEFTGVSARDTAAALEQLMIAVREVAASMDDKDNKEVGKTTLSLSLSLSLSV